MPIKTWLSQPAVLLPMLSGLLIGTSYIPFPPWAAFFCLVPLFVSWVRTTSAKSAFWQGWLTQFVLNLIGFHWVAHTAYEFGHLPRVLAVILLVLFCATAHLYYALAGWATIRLLPTTNASNDSPGLRLAVAAMLLLFLEAALPVLFPWHLGYTWLWAGWPGVQTADVIGFEGLNIATVGLNAALAYAWLARGRLRKALAVGLAGVIVVIGLNVWGLGRKSEWDAPDARVKILAVQGNIGNFEKIYAQKGAGYQGVIIARYFALTRDGLARHPEAQAVLWPETAFPDNLDRVFLTRPNPQALRGFAREIGRTIVTGAYSEDIGKRTPYNGFFAIGPDGEPIQDGYRKSILLAFGEYIPGSKYFPWIFDLIPAISSFGRGNGPTTLPLPIGPGGQIAQAGPQICYEGLYPDFSAGLGKAGAEIILNVTNDSWFGDAFEPRQHLFMTLARALEIRRPLLRATNTGITTAILANGDILEASPQNQEWSGLFDIRFQRNPRSTIYQKIEGFWPPVLAICAGLLVVFAHVKRRNATRSSPPSP